MPIPIKPRNNMIKFYKAYIAQMGIPSYPVTLPDGSEITISREKPYITSDLATATFIARNVRFITVTDANAEEVKVWMYHPENLPYICKDLSARGDIVERFKWTPTDEKMIANILLKRGYDVHKHVSDRIPADAVGRGEVSKKELKLMIATLENAGYDVIKKEIPVVEVVEETPIVGKPEANPFDFKSIKELRKLSKLLGINSFGKSRDALAIEVQAIKVKEKAEKK